MIGPVDLSPHERLGLLVEGFGGYHNPGMPYNPPTIRPCWSSAGWRQKLIYSPTTAICAVLPQKLVQVAERYLENRSSNLIVLIPGSPGRGEEILAAIHSGSLDVIWGFTDLSRRRERLSGKE